MKKWILLVALCAVVQSDNMFCSEAHTEGASGVLAVTIPRLDADNLMSESTIIQKAQQKKAFNSSGSQALSLGGAAPVIQCLSSASQLSTWGDLVSSSQALVNPKGVIRSYLSPVPRMWSTSLNGQISTLRHGLGQARELFFVVEEDNRKKGERIGALVQALGIATFNRTTAEKSLQEKEQELAKLKQEKEQAENKIAGHLAKIQALSDQFQQEGQAHQAEKIRLDVELAKLQQHIVRMKQDIDSMNQAQTVSAEALARQLAQIKELEATLGREKEHYKTELEAAKKKADDDREKAEGQLKAAHKALDARKDRISELGTELYTAKYTAKFDLGLHTLSVIGNVIALTWLAHYNRLILARYGSNMWQYSLTTIIPGIQHCFLAIVGALGNSMERHPYTTGASGLFFLGSAACMYRNKKFLKASSTLRKMAIGFSAAAGLVGVAHPLYQAYS